MNRCPRILRLLGTLYKDKINGMLFVLKLQRTNENMIKIETK